MKKAYFFVFSALCFYGSNSQAMYQSDAQRRAKADAIFRQGQESNRRIQREQQQTWKRMDDMRREAERKRREEEARQRQAARNTKK